MKKLLQSLVGIVALLFAAGASAAADDPVRLNVGF